MLEWSMGQSNHHYQLNNAMVRNLKNTDCPGDVREAEKWTVLRGTMHHIFVSMEARLSSKRKEKPGFEQAT